MPRAASNPSALIAGALWASLVVLASLAGAVEIETLTADFQDGPPPLQSMSALSFGPEGLLFVGDARAGAVVAVDTGDREPLEVNPRLRLSDLETKIAALLGARASEVLIHDLAVNPASHQVYLAVSRGRARWENSAQMPNDLADADVLLRISPAGELEHVELEGLRWSRATLSSPIDPAKMSGGYTPRSLRTQAITDMAWDASEEESAAGELWIAGLSNEEFASTLWRLDFPFAGEASRTSVEVFHGSHAKWETHAPIRTFAPFSFDGERHLIAAYLCTPLVTFETDRLREGEHVKGRTVAEFGFGSYPLDMVVFQKFGKNAGKGIAIIHTELPMMVVDPADIAGFEGQIDSRIQGFTAGVPFRAVKGSGFQQLDVLDSQVLVGVKRQPGGTLDLVTLQTLLLS